jgi:hypothetical protein
MVVEKEIDGGLRRRTFLVEGVDMELGRRNVYDRSLDDLLVVYYTPFLVWTGDDRGREILIGGVDLEVDIVLFVEEQEILLLGGYLVDSWTWNFLVDRNTSHLRTVIVETLVLGTWIEVGFDLSLVVRAPFQGLDEPESRIVVSYVPFQRQNELVGEHQVCSVEYRRWEGGLILRGFGRCFRVMEEFDFVDLSGGFDL